VESLDEYEYCSSSASSPTIRRQFMLPALQSGMRMGCSSARRLFLPASDLDRVHSEICAIWGAVLCALMASTATLAFRLGG
jgi:hypothetical protein